MDKEDKVKEENKENIIVEDDKPQKRIKLDEAGIEKMKSTFKNKIKHLEEKVNGLIVNNI